MEPLTLTNHRFNPFTEVINHIAITNEVHTITFHTEKNAYGIILDECIYRSGSLPFNNHVDYSIVENNTGADVFNEIPRASDPNQGEFRVDYDDEDNGYFNSAFIEFNIADSGKSVVVDYRGTGSVVKHTYKSSQNFEYPNLTIDGLTKTESLMFDNTGDPIIDGVVDVIDGDDDTKLPTEGAVYNFARPDKRKTRRQFEVADLETGDQVTAGDVVEMINGKVRKGAGFPDVGTVASFTTSETQHLTAVLINSTKFLVAWSDQDDTDNGKAIIGTIEGKAISYGSPVTFSTGAIVSIDSCLAATDKVFLSYVDGTAGKMIACTISGTVPTFGSEVNFNSGNSSGLNACSDVTTDKVAVIWDDNTSNDVQMVVATLSGTTISPGSEVQVDSSSAFGPFEIIKLDTDKLCVSYLQTAKGVTVSGTVPTIGDRLLITNSTSGGVKMLALDTSNIILISSPASGGYNIGFNFLKQTGSTVEFVSQGAVYCGSGETNDISPTTSYHIGLQKLEDGSILIAHSAAGVSNKGLMITRLLSHGNMLQVVSSKSITQEVVLWAQLLALGSDNKFVAVATNSVNTPHNGFAIAGDIGHLIGISEQTGLQSDNVDVIIDGVAEGLSSITKGLMYFSDNGELNTIGIGKQIGFGLSTTEILLKIQ